MPEVLRISTAGAPAAFLTQRALDAEAAGPGGDADLGDRNFDATGRIFCSSGRETVPGECAFGIVRRGAAPRSCRSRGPGGGETGSHFRSGEPLRLEPAQAFTWIRDGDVTTIRVHTSEHYEVPDAVIFGRRTRPEPDRDVSN